jgi:hypothetical protein
MSNSNRRPIPQTHRGGPPSPSPWSGELEAEWHRGGRGRTHVLGLPPSRPRPEGGGSVANPDDDRIDEFHVLDEAAAAAKPKPAAKSTSPPSPRTQTEQWRKAAEAVAAVLGGDSHLFCPCASSQWGGRGRAAPPPSHVKGRSRPRCFATEEEGAAPGGDGWGRRRPHTGSVSCRRL